VRATVVDLLADLGYRVLKAKDAASALAIVESGMPVDLLFTDVVMPGPLRSPELARKACQRLPNMAVLFTSGYTDNAIVHGGRLDDGIELLSKPYTREALARKIRQVLRGQQQRNAARQAAAPERTAGAPRPAPDAGLHVLLVEDDELVRMTTVDMLTGLGHRVEEAGTARQALAVLAKTPVQVLIADVGLPDMSGVELAAQARAAMPELKVVFATGHDVVPGQDPEGGLADAVRLLKPYGEDDLVQALEGTGARPR